MPRSVVRGAVRSAFDHPGRPVSSSPNHAGGSNPRRPPRWGTRPRPRTARRGRRGTRRPPPSKPPAATRCLTLSMRRPSCGPTGTPPRRRRPARSTSVRTRPPPAFTVSLASVSVSRSRTSTSPSSAKYPCRTGVPASRSSGIAGTRNFRSISAATTPFSAPPALPCTLLVVSPLPPRRRRARRPRRGRLRRGSARRLARSVLDTFDGRLHAEGALLELHGRARPYVRADRRSHRGPDPPGPAGVDRPRRRRAGRPSCRGPVPQPGGSPERGACAPHRLHHVVHRSPGPAGGQRGKVVAEVEVHEQIDTPGGAGVGRDRAAGRRPRRRDPRTRRRSCAGGRRCRTGWHVGHHRPTRRRVATGHDVVAHRAARWPPTTPSSATAPCSPTWSPPSRSTVDGTVDDLDAEFLHELRVAVRRTRSVLGEAKGVLPEDVRTRFGAELKSLARASPPIARDLDVYVLGWDDYVCRSGRRRRAARAGARRARAPPASPPTPSWRQSCAASGPPTAAPLAGTVARTTTPWPWRTGRPRSGGRPPHREGQRRCCATVGRSRRIAGRAPARPAQGRQEAALPPRVLRERSCRPGPARGSSASSRCSRTTSASTRTPRSSRPAAGPGRRPARRARRRGRRPAGRGPAHRPPRSPTVGRARRVRHPLRRLRHQGEPPGARRPARRAVGPVGEGRRDLQHQGRRREDEHRRQPRVRGRPRGRPRAGVGPRPAGSGHLPVPGAPEGRRAAASAWSAPAGELAAHIRGSDLSPVHVVPADFSLRHLDLHLDATDRPAARLAALLDPLATTTTWRCSTARRASRSPARACSARPTPSSCRWCRPRSPAARSSSSPVPRRPGAPAHRAAGAVDGRSPPSAPQGARRAAPARPGPACSKPTSRRPR